MAEPRGTAEQRLATRARAAIGALALALIAAWIVLGGFVDLAPGKAHSAGLAGKRARAHRVERELRQCVNVRRHKHGLKRLRVAQALKRAARLHAKNMAHHGFFGHVDQKGRDPGDRISLFHPKLRFVAIGENIAGGQGGANAVCRAWMGSSGHRANILGHYNRIGAGFWPGGYYRRYFVVEFARAR